MGKRGSRKASTAHNFVWFLVFVACLSGLVVWGSAMLETDPAHTADDHGHSHTSHDAAAVRAATAPKQTKLR